MATTLQRLNNDWFLDKDSVTFRITEDDNYQPIKSNASGHIYRSPKDLQSVMLVTAFCQLSADKDIYIQYVQNSAKTKIPYEGLSYVNSDSAEFLTVFKAITCRKEP